MVDLCGHISDQNCWLPRNGQVVGAIRVDFYGQE